MVECKTVNRVAGINASQLSSESILQVVCGYHLAGFIFCLYTDATQTLNNHMQEGLLP